MLPFLTQPAAAPTCHVPREADGAALLFRGGQSLSRTMSAGNRRKWTLAWVATYESGFVTSTTSAAATTSDYVQISPSRIGFHTGPTTNCDIQPVRAARDPNAFGFHCIGVDVDHATQADRMIYWENGARPAVTAVTPCQSADTFFNTAGKTMYFGINGGWGGFDMPMKGIVGDAFFIDGAQLPASVFGEFNIHGVWVSKPRAEIHAAVAAAGGWGANGFHLDFSDPLNPGKDVSGQGNHFTASGFDASGKDTLASTPTNVYATLNPLRRGSTGTRTLSDGNLVAETGSANADGIGGFSTLSIPSGQAVQAEFTLEATSLLSQCSLGIAGRYTAVWNSGAAALGNMAVGETYGVVTRADMSAVDFYRNGVLAGTLPTTENSATGGDTTFWLHGVGNVGPTRWRTNFGQRPFAYPVTGAKPLCTANLPEPAVKDPAEGIVQATATGADMAAVLDAATALWNGQWVEIVKRRDAAEDWRVRFSDDPANGWATNTANAKAAAPALAPAGSYVAIRLRIGKKYRVWTAEVEHVTGTDTTVTHGFGTARNVVIATRVSVGGGDRHIRHPDMPEGWLGKLNGSGQVAADGILTAFDPSSFRIAATAPSGTYRVIVLAGRVGYLDLPNWGGNGSAEGPFVSMTVAPAFMLSCQSGGWEMLSKATSPANPCRARLALNQSAIEDVSAPVADLVVGGAKMRSNAAAWNTSGATHYGIAIGRPVGGVCVAPATAR